MNSTLSSHLSLIQKQFWLLNQTYPDSPAYNIPSVFRIKGQLNKDALEYGLNEIIKRHEIFRTCFIYDGVDIQQHIFPAYKLNVNVEQYTEKFEKVKNEDIDQIVKKEISAPFDLSRLPLLRVIIVQFLDDIHILIVTMHHIITDLRTKDLFAEELELFYFNYISNTDANSLEEIKQYLDYCKWQDEWLESNDYSSKSAFWKNQLKDQKGILDLPMENSRPSVFSQNGKIVRIDLDNQLTAEMKVYSRKCSVNIYLLMLSAYVLLLYRYSGIKDITIGVPLTNRRKADFKNTMGPFVNIIPLRIIISDKMNFSELLHCVRMSMLNAHRNQEVPYISILNQANYKKDTSYNPLFQTGFTFEHPMNLSLNGLSVESVYAHNGGSQLDMFATFWESETNVHGVFEYNDELFNAGIAERLAESYIFLLKNIVKQDDNLVSKFPVISEREVEKIIVGWNATDIIPSKIGCVHTLFEKQAEARPDSVAVIFGDKHLTYGELNRRANQLSAFLIKQGIAPGDYIGIYLNRSLDMIVALLGILKAGAAYVPIDPEFPEMRITYMISCSKVAAIVSEEGLTESLSGMDVKIITCSDWNTFDDKNTVNPDIPITSDNLAYVIFTSGSTGNPKGVQVHHGAVVNFLISMSHSPGMSEQDVLLAVTTLSFDIAVLELFLPLSVGARTVIASKEIAADGAQLFKAINHYDITFIQATPVTFRLLIQAGWEDKRNLKVLCGGESMPADLAEKIVERSSEVWNMYGPTETTVWSTCCRVKENSGTVSIGRPIANTKLYILDEYMQPVPIGVEGSLFIGGAGVAKGYLNQPELTEAKFVKNPFSTQKSDIIYNTGDIAKYRNDGSVEIIGRSDFQLKLNGLRIESGEIEVTLESHHQITQSKVLVYKYDENDSRLVAYYTTLNNIQLNAGEIRACLVGRLPDYMIPSIFIKVDGMPLTPNGKVDRSQLPKPEINRSVLEYDYEPPRNHLEIILCEIWCSVLKLEKVGVNDKFFEIGGTSLLSVQVISQINKKLNKPLRLVIFYQHPTIRSLADFLESGKDNGIEKKKNVNRAKLRKESLIRSKERNILN